jgi:hypothetical protein
MRHLIAASFAFFALTLGPLAGHARAQSNESAAVPRVQAAPRAADVASIDGIIAAVYDVISGPAGQKRDWDRMRSLFAPGARLMPTTPVRPPGTPFDAPLKGDETYATLVFSLEDFITRVDKNTATEGFFEREVARRMESYGHITHVWSTYESRHAAADAKPFVRGINSIQLMNDGKRWWVVSIFWESEKPRMPLPEQYLKSVR